MAKKAKKTKQLNSKGTCKVCNHSMVLEIEMAMLAEKKSSREVAKMVLDAGGESVSYLTILTHMQRCVDEKRELIVKYLYEKRCLIESRIQEINDNYEIDEQAIQLAALKNLDASIFEASILIRQSSKALQEQLALRVIQNDDNKDEKVKVLGVDRQPADLKKSYVPVQQTLVTLYKAASEELRQTTKAKIEILGIDAESRKSSSIESLVDILLLNDAEDEEKNGAEKS